MPKWNLKSSGGQVAHNYTPSAQESMSSRPAWAMKQMLRQLEL